MNYDEKRTIIDICEREGPFLLDQFNAAYSSTDRVEMAIDAGYSDQLLQWFKEEKPEEFKSHRQPRPYSWDKIQDDLRRTLDLRASLGRVV